MHVIVFHQAFVHQGVAELGVFATVTLCVCRLECWSLTKLVLHAGFLLYVVIAVAAILIFMLRLAPEHGTTSIYVYITICSLAGSLSVMSCKV